MHRSSKLKLSLLALSAISAMGIDHFGANTGFDFYREAQAAIRTSQFKNWGLANEQAKSHIAAVEAWTIEEGKKDIIVAVIDTGIDPKHPDLAPNLWKDKTQSKAAVYGWNYVTNSANPRDEHGHGTHVAGIIGAVANPKAGVSGVAQKVSIMAVKYYSDANPGSVNLRNTIQAIEYAVKNGARIINYSGGGPEASELERLAIKKAEAKGILFVSAAGNDGKQTGTRDYSYYPSAYGYGNIISVAATDINNQLLKTSNYGGDVDIAAPGENIYSTLPGAKYGTMTGTSQATAFVSGVAALLLSQNPKLTPAELKEIIMNSADPLDHLNGKVGSSGKVNAYSALLALRNGGKKPKPSNAGLFAGRLLNPGHP